MKKLKSENSSLIFSPIVHIHTVKSNTINGNMQQKRLIVFKTWKNVQKLCINIF